MGQKSLDKKFLIPLKISWNVIEKPLTRATTLLQTSPPLEVCTKCYGLPKLGVPISRIRNKMTFRCKPHAQA